MNNKRRLSIRLTALLLALVCSAALFTFTVYAATEDDGYYYRSMDVTMTVGSDKRVDVTEVLTVEFLEERHGIFRNIPLYSPVEGYEISNVSVDGDNYSTYTEGDDIVVKIGDADRTIRGEHTYVIRYTLEMLADADPSFDYLYLNVIGQEFDTEIRSANVEITLPSGTDVVNCSVTSGEYGSTDNRYADAASKGNILRVTSTDVLPAFNGITVELTLPEGTFADAPQPVIDAVVDELDVDIKADEYGTLSVTEKYTVTPACGFTFVRNIYSDADPAGSTVGMYLDSLTIECPEYPGAVKTIAHDYSGSALVDLSCAEKDVPFEFTVRYDLRTDLVSADDFSRIYMDFAGNSGLNARFDKIHLTADIPGLTSAELVSDFREAFNQAEAFTADVSDGKAVFDLKEPLGAADNASLTVTVEGADGLYARKGTAFDYATPGIAAVLAALLAAFSGRKKEKQLVPAVEYYPPAGLNPAEVGYIIDSEISSADVTTLVYYWASHGHLRVEFTSKNSFTLHKISELDAAHREYEKVMFNALWKYGDGMSVKSSSLEEKFYTSIQNASRAIKRIYTGKNALYNTKSQVGSVLAGLGGAAAVVAAVAAGAMAYRFSAFGTVSSAMFAALMILVAARTLRLRHIRQYREKGGSAWRIVVAAIFSVLAFVILATTNGSVPMLSAIITAAAAALVPVFASRILRRTDLGTDLLGKCVGFRDFLKTAEKERLEMLLEQDPDYYYNILPYAQVLGVSSIWSKKFESLVTEPPTWADGTTRFGDVYLTRMMMRSMNNVSRSMTSMPSSDSSYGGGGFGGGFGGGGFSGGGGGGGGGGSW